MSPEFMAVIGAAIALAAVILSSQRAMRREIGDMRQEMHQEVSALRQEVRQEIGKVHQEIRKVQQDIGDLRERMARLEGLFEGFTKTVPGPQPQAAPSPQPQQ